MPDLNALLIVVAVAFAVPFVLGLLPRLRVPSVVAEIVAGIVQTPLLISVILCATALGVLVPVLKDAEQIASPFGQLVIAAGSVADIGAIVLLSLFFSGEGSIASTAAQLCGFLLLGLLVYWVVRTATHLNAIERDVMRLDLTSAQIRVRGAMVLLIGFAALAVTLGLELILGAFVAGAVLSLLDGGAAGDETGFRARLEAVGFGLFIPVFFVATGVAFDLDALVAETASLAMVPVFLVALVVVRGMPAILYRGALGDRHAAVAGLLQATSLPLIVAATAIGVELRLMSASEQAALITAGLASVLVFPAVALTLLRTGNADADPTASHSTRPCSGDTGSLRSARGIFVPGDHISRGFTGRRRETGDPARIPPGQHLTPDFPVLSAGPTPRVPLDEWNFTIDGAVDAARTWTWEELVALPVETPTVDIHCVTSWSKLDTSWRGVSLDTLLEDVDTAAEYVTAWCDGGYTTNLPLEDVTDGKAWVAWEYEGEPLDAEHGGPARLLVPHLYFWKSAKWVRGLSFTIENEPGFWETYGYHDRGDPWLEQRYQGD